MKLMLNLLLILYNVYLNSIKISLKNCIHYINPCNNVEILYTLAFTELHVIFTETYKVAKLSKTSPVPNNTKKISSTQIPPPV